MQIEKHVSSRAVALETTLLVHGVPIESAMELGAQLDEIVRGAGSCPALIGVVDGKPTIGMNRDQLQSMVNCDEVPKVNTANLGIALHRGGHAATTVSTTMELAAFAGLRVFATGGLGGIHEGYGTEFDISADLVAFTRYPIGVVTSGVKSILDVVATREAFESLGVSVIGYQTDSFPAFYLRESGAGVDARFETPKEIADFIRHELPRTGRGIVIANPIPKEFELDRVQWDAWLEEARGLAHDDGARGRGVTPAVLGHLHRISDGKTLESNIALIKSNAELAARIESEL